MKVLLLLLLVCLSAGAAPAFVQANYAEAIPVTGLTVPFNSTTTAGNFLVVGMRPSDGSQNLTVTAGGQTFTRVANAPIVTEYSYSIFILYNAPAVNSVVMTGGDSSDQQRGWALEFSGMPTSGSIEDSGTGSGTSTTVNAGNVDTATAGALLVMGGATDSDEFHTDPTPSADWTMVDLQTCCDDDKTAVMFRVAGAAGNYGGTMTESQGPSWSAIIGAFAADGGGGGGGAVTNVQLLGRVSLTGKVTLQ